MSNKHQIIYTSCKRGIQGSSGGEQIYSHDESFRESSSDTVRKLFTYHIPSLAPGVVMTETIAETMPQSFIYRRLPDGSCAIVLNTYLGRDYMEGGRFGNYLSHAIICDESDINAYPCEFYGSEILRSRMEPDEVRSSEKPPFLPEPGLIKGYNVSAERASDFLCADDRMEIYKKMVAAMLSYKSARKRVIICDSPENTIMWIAALQYALPLELALNVNFTTYEYEPSLSFSQICGVLNEGTKYSVNNAGDHYTFDFINNIAPDIETEGDFFDFIDMAMSMSLDSIQAFHEFIREKLTYRNPDEQYYGIYSLYCLFTDSLENIQQNTFKRAMQMLETFALENAKDELVGKLVGEKYFILSANDEYAMEILEFILSRMRNTSNEVQETIRALVTEKAVSAFASTSATEDSFLRQFSPIEDLCKKNNIVITCELMKEKNREMLLSAMSGSPEQWRWNFILDLLCDYVIAQNIPEQLSVNHEMGQLIRSIIKARVENKSALIARTMNKFANHWIYLVNMTLNIESIFSSLADFLQISNSNWLWKSIFCKIIAKTQVADIRDIYSLLLTKNRHKTVFAIYEELMNTADSINTAKKLLKEQLGINNNEYANLYTLKIYECYYTYLKNSKEADAPKAQIELLKLLMARNIAPACIDELITVVLSGIPIENPSRENGELVESILTYYKKQNIKDRLLLIVSGMILSKAKSKSELSDAIKRINAMSGGKTINMDVLQAVDIENYIKWVVPNIYVSCGSANDLIQSYELFNHTKSSSRRFISICAVEAFKEEKGDKKFGKILMFLKFFFKAGDGDAEGRQETGEILCKLNKRKLENLDEAVKVTFKGEKSYLEQWKRIREIAATLNHPYKNIQTQIERNGDDAR